MLKQDVALAVEGEFGILEGRTFALIHPIVMASLFLYTLWAGYLGWQWRRVRTIQNEINELKKQVKPTPVTPEEVPPPSEIELKIQQLTEVSLLLWFPLLYYIQQISIWSLTSCLKNLKLPKLDVMKLIFEISMTLAYIISLVKRFAPYVFFFLILYKI